MEGVWVFKHSDSQDQTANKNEKQAPRAAMETLTENISIPQGSC